MMSPDRSVTSIRLATGDDLPRIAEIHRLAYSRSHFTALLPHAVLMRYYGTFLGDGTRISVAIDRDGRVNGFVVYGTGIPEKIAAFKAACARDILLTSLRHPWMAGRKALKAVRARFNPRRPMQPTDFLLLSIAVDPAARGLGNVLLGEVVAAAPRDGHCTIGLYVNDDNTRAIASYRRSGFETRELYDGQYYMEAASPAD